jgi:2-aminoethylphosphonate-pyruvate transaminase
MAHLSFNPFLKPDVQASIIVTFHAPAHPNYDFKRFYDGAKKRDFILYPGKLTEVETFRVGCIGAIGRNDGHPGRYAGALKAGRRVFSAGRARSPRSGP